MAKTYDTQCLALAIEFLHDAFNARESPKGKLDHDIRKALIDSSAHELAREIQTCIEDYLRREGLKL